MKRLVVLLALLLSATFTGLSGCRTVEGVGRDIESAGDAIADEARETRQRRN